MVTWWKGSDDLVPNKKVQRLLEMRHGHLAFTLHISGFCRCASQLTDGRLTPTDLRVVANLALVPPRLLPQLISLLINVKLWEQDGEDYLIHDYLDYNPSADEVKAQRRKNAERQRRRRNTGSNGDSHAATHGTSNAPPVPSRPVP